MRIYGIDNTGYNQTFGIKVPTRTALEAASGRFFDNSKISYKRQKNLLRKLGNIETRKLYTGELAEALRSMRNGIRKQHPELAIAADRIGKVCDNFDRTFLTENEIQFNEILRTAINNEIKQINKTKIDIEPMALKDLGLDKYENL